MRYACTRVSVSWCANARKVYHLEVAPGERLSVTLVTARPESMNEILRTDEFDSGDVQQEGEPPGTSTDSSVVAAMPANVDMKTLRLLPTTWTTPIEAASPS